MCSACGKICQIKYRHNVTQHAANVRIMTHHTKLPQKLTQW